MMPPLLRPVAWLPAILLVAACAIDVGTTPDAGPCLASPDYFVSDVKPRYFDGNPGGTPIAGQCSQRDCHESGGRGHGTFRLEPWTAPPTAGTPVAQWPAAWRDNYLSAIQLLDCENPTASRLLTFPEGTGNLHPPGPVVYDRAAARQLFTTWIDGSQ